MASMNRAFLMGNLGADPEVRYTSSGGAVANFRIATTEVWNDRQSGERQERTEWHRIVVWGKQAEQCGEYLRKGRQVLVEGRIQTREWTDQQNQKRYTTEILADRVTFLGSLGGEAGDRAGSGDEFQPRARGGYGARGGGGGGGGAAGGGGGFGGGGGGGGYGGGGGGDFGGGAAGGGHDDPPPLGDDDIPF